MRWFVYPDVSVEDYGTISGTDDRPDLEFIRFDRSSLRGLIGQLEITDDPLQAEFFLVPVVLNQIGLGEPSQPETLGHFFDLFPWFSRSPERHAIFFLGDNPVVPEVCRNSAVFMPSCSSRARSLPMPYLVEETRTGMRPILEADFEVSFQGTITTGGRVRAELVEALGSCRSRLVSCLVTDRYFHGIDDAIVRQSLHDDYFRRIERSRFVFCPRGDGLSSLRFFETLKPGRLPILVADETALPLERSIPYQHFVVRVPEARIGDWESYLDAFLAAHPDLDYCSSLARNTSRIWFSSESLGRFVERSLSER